MQSAGLQAIDEIVPTLLRALEDDETSDTALDGLKQILRYFNLHIILLPFLALCYLPSYHHLYIFYFILFSVRTAAVLPHILPKLVQLPLSYGFLSQICIVFNLFSSLVLIWVWLCSVPSMHML